MDSSPQRQHFQTIQAFWGFSTIESYLRGFIVILHKYYKLSIRGNKVLYLRWIDALYQEFV